MQVTVTLSAETPNELARLVGALNASLNPVNNATPLGESLSGGARPVDRVAESNVITAEAKVEGKKKRAAKQAAPAAVPDEPAVTIDDVKAVAMKIRPLTGGFDAAKAALAKFGAKTFTDVQAKDFEALRDELQAFFDASSEAPPVEDEDPLGLDL